MTDPVDLIILAGGRGRRLGGADKGGLVVRGRTLLRQILEDVDPGGRTVVVTPHPLPEPLPRPDISRTLEEPRDGGPVAGVAAGLARLDEVGPDDRPPAWVAVVAVDQPGAADALTSLIAALPHVGDDVEAFSQLDGAGRRPWLLALYRRDVLHRELAALPTAHGASMRGLVEHLTWAEIDDGAEHLGDIDTWDDVDVWAAHVVRDDISGSC